MVTLENNDEGWTLLRDGEPYFIKGAGGDEHLELLVRCGGNSIRTWGTDGVGSILDRAHALGLSVTVGLWLLHERHGFDYADAAAVRKQFETAKRHVLQYKDHPALLLWGIGNEMEASGENEAVWRHVNDIAIMIHELDPAHPTMTVIADVCSVKIAAMKRICPDVDILGINSYGGLPTVPARLREHGWSRPFIVTEFGPKGWWEVRKTSWGAEIEQSSAEKADFYRDNYRACIEGELGWCLGSYVFKWGFKQEHTSTWFSMLSETGAKYSTVEAMSEVWGGSVCEPRHEPDVAVKNGMNGTKCPIIRVFDSTAAERELGAAETHRVQLEFEHFGDAPPGIRWEIQEESSDKKEGGDAESAPRLLSDFIVAEDETGLPGYSVVIRTPDRPGAYRLYVYVEDDDAATATANFPFRVVTEADHD